VCGEIELLLELVAGQDEGLPCAALVPVLVNDLAWGCDQWPTAEHEGDQTIERKWRADESLHGAVGWRPAVETLR
jgi:hypothetical protein